MAEKTMTLAEALSLKKSLERKIDKRIQKIKLAYIPVNGKDLVEHKKEYEEFVLKMQSTYQSLDTMRKNHEILSCAIVTANAKTKTDLVNELTQQPYTISDLLCILSDDISDEINASLNDGYFKAKSKQGAFIDPFGEELRDKVSIANENFKEEAKMAIEKANGKKKIKVNFID